MNNDLTDRYHAMSPDDRRRVEIVATNLLLSAAIDCPNGREARVLKRAFAVVEELGKETAKEASK